MNDTVFPDLSRFSRNVFSKELPVQRMETPLGSMLAVFGGSGLCLLDFAGQKHFERELKAVQTAFGANFVWRETEAGTLLQNELDGYFAGRLKTFATPVQMVGTPFQRQVWRVLQTIGYGETRSYKEQSQQLGNPHAIRAVAAANGQNKISILIPCHRVIGSDGSLTGYAGGVERKRFLLELERGNRQETLGF